MLLVKPWFCVRVILYTQLQAHIILSFTSTRNGRLEEMNTRTTKSSTPLIIALTMVLGGLSTTSLAIDPTYTLVNQQTGINATTVPAPGYTGQHNVMSGGMSVGDFNNDSWPDLYISGLGTTPDMLYINQQDGTFLDEADLYGIAYTHYGFGSAVGDVNNDGLPDLYVVSYGPSDDQATTAKNLLYVNNGPDKNGQYSFSEQAAQRGVNDIFGIVGGKGVCFGDMDLDGDLDLYIATWGFFENGNRLYENDGTGHYTDVSQAVLPENETIIRGFTPKFVDVNNDKYPDLLLTADFTTSFLYINNGPDENGQITFRDTTEESGIVDNNNGMGATVADFNGDGMLDWFMTNIYVETASYYNTLYMGLGNNESANPNFLNQATVRGVGDIGWGWGVVSGDHDNDGDIDMVATSGWPSWPSVPTRFWSNDGNANFSDIANITGLTFNINGRGLIQFDYDHDGDLDLAFVDNGGPFRIYRNNLGFDNFTRYLRINLNTDNHPCLAPMGYGTRVVATYNGQDHLHVVDGSSGYLGQSEMTIHFGLADQAVVDQVRIEWNDGTVTTLVDVPADQELTVFAYHQLDFTQDGNFDYYDISLFLQTYMAGDLGADVTGDSSLDFNDIMSFILQFPTPCG